MIHSDTAPSRSVPDKSWPMVAALLMLAVIPFHTQFNSAAMVLLAVLAAWSGFQSNLQVSAALGSLAVFAGLCAVEIDWPWPCVGASLTYASFAAAWRLPRSWCARGVLSRRVLAAVGACITIAAATLVGWAVLAQPDLQVFRARLPADGGLTALAGLALAFSCINAAGEELMYRGVLMDALRRTFGSNTMAVAGQALVFGAMHWHGFPNGWWGVGLATIYGCMMAGLRLFSGGMLAPWFAHVLADTVIVLLVGTHGIVP